MIKRKLPEFDDDRFGEAEAWSPGRLGEAELLGWIERMVQPARVASARSKVGTEVEAIVEEVALDVAIDLGLAFTEAWAQLGEPAQERALGRAKELARDQLAGRGRP